MSGILRRARRVVPILAAVAAIGSSIVGWVLSDSNALGAPAQTFDILRSMRVGVSVTVGMIVAATVPFILRPQLLPAVGVSLFAVAMTGCCVLAALLRDEPWQWVPAASAALCGFGAIVHLNLSYAVGEEKRSRRRRSAAS